jgi:hypothetical protein
MWPPAGAGAPAFCCYAQALAALANAINSLPLLECRPVQLTSFLSWNLCQCDKPLPSPGV